MLFFGIFISGNHLAHSRHVGFYTAIGIASGTFIHVVVGFIGLTALILQLTWLFNILKIIGATYLVYLGYKALTTKKSNLDFSYQKSQTTFSKSKAVKIGLFTCLSNPKSALFYFSLFTAVIPPTSPFWAKVVMVLMMVFLSAGWYACVAFLFSQAVIQNLYAKFERLINYLVGGLFIGLGIRIAIARR